MPTDISTTIDQGSTTPAGLPASAKILGNPAGKGGYSGSENAQSREEVVKYIVAWEDRAAMRAAIVGSPQTVTISGVTTTRVIPLPSPYTAGLYAVAYSFEGQGKRSTNENKPYNYVLFTVTFGILTNGAGSDSPYYSLSEQGGSRSITIPNSRNTFDGNGEVLDSGIPLTFPGVSYVFTIYQLNNLQTFRNTALAMLDTPVNSTTLTLGGLAIPAGRALLETYSVDSTVSALGVVQHSAQIVINYSSLPWNSFIRSDGQEDTISPKPYQAGDLNTLIQ